MNVGMNKNNILSVEVAVLLTDLRCGRVNIYCSQIIKLIVVKLLNDILTLRNGTYALRILLYKPSI